MDQVKKWIKEGHSLAAAVKAGLGPTTVQKFAEDYALDYSHFSKVINLAATASPKELDALSSELEGTQHEWALLIWEQAKPKKVAV